MRMRRLLGITLLGFATVAVGCETGSTKMNSSTTGAKGQNVGADSNVSGPVPSSTTGTQSNVPQQPAQGKQATAPGSSGQAAPRK